MNSDKYDVIIRQWAGNYEIPFYLAKAVVRWESSFREDAVSRCGAKGLMQLMPAIYKQEGIDPLDPMDNVRVGCAYLKSLWDIFEDEKGLERWKFALGSYNAGLKYIIDAQRLATKAGAKTYKWYHISVFLIQARYRGGIFRPWRHCDWKQVTEYVDRIVERMYNYEIEHVSRRIKEEVNI